MSGTFHNVHVDSQFVYAYVIPDGNENEIFLKDQLQEALNNRNSQIRVILSFLVLGETINTINKKDKPDWWKRKSINSLVDLSFHKKVELKPPIVSMFSLAQKLMKHDYGLDDTDALIFSQAFCDKESYLVLFQDDSILTSSIIQEYCQLRKENANFPQALKVRETFA